MSGGNPRILWYPGHELIVPDMVRAEGCHVWDSSGKRYLDLESGVWCASVGHGHPRVVAAMTRQACAIAHNGFNYSSPIVDEAAREILPLCGFGDNGRCVFLCSGSEAVEYGVRVAQMIAHRPLLLTLADSYFGAYGSASRKSVGEWIVHDWLAGDDVGTLPWDRIGGFLFEPGSSSGLVRFPPAGLVERIAREVQARGGFVLVNEVTVGVGRTGKWFGHQHYPIAPDMVAMGKGIGNGYPVSVAAFGPRMVEALRDREVAYAQSHQNDPVGAAVALEVVRVIREEGLIERARALGLEIADALAGVAERHRGRFRDVRGRGLMAALELNDDPQRTLTTQVHHELLGLGFLVGRRPRVPVLRVDPPLVIAREEVMSFVGALESIVKG